MLPWRSLNYLEEPLPLPLNTVESWGRHAHRFASPECWPLFPGDQMLTVEKRHPDHAEPLTWNAVQFSHGEKSATMLCSNGHALSLHNHKICENGEVTPSVVCPEADCDFHDLLTLAHWDEF